MLSLSFRRLAALALIGSFASALPARETTAFDVEAFSTASWRGKMSPERAAELMPLRLELLQAMRNRDDAAIARLKARLVESFGDYVGAPEEKPVYGQPIDASEPDVKRITALWEKSVQQEKGHFGWEQARTLEPEPGFGGRAQRLRTSERVVRGLLESAEAGLPNAKQERAWAIEGLDYFVSAQTKQGVFGYPYDPAYQGTGLKKTFVKIADEGRAAGRVTTDRGWVVDDGGEGGLQFDNGVTGRTLLLGYEVTGDKRYLEAAKRAGEWAIPTPMVRNFNYNGFSGILLARLYRVTGDPKWLAAAKVKFRYGVLPGQLPNGRWLDQHNAKIQYHGELMVQLSEYWLALHQAGDPEAATVEREWRLGLANLCEEITQLGTADAANGRSIEALSMALMILGPNETWERSLNIVVNYITGPFGQDLVAQRKLLPDTVATWLLYRAKRDGGPKPPARTGQ